MNRANNQDKVNKLRQEIRALRSEQESLSNKIERLSKELHTLSLETDQFQENQKTKESKVTLDQCRSKIGNKVRIINPKPGEPSTGLIHRVGQLYVTVKLPDQTVRRRIASNLRLISS